MGQRLNLGFISTFAGDFAASEKEARTALEISPTAAQSYLVLAEAQLGQGEIDKAADSYHQLEKFGPFWTSTACAGLADIAAYQGKYSEAARILTQGAAADEAAKMADNAARKYAVLANMLEQLQGHNPAAMADIGKALANSQSAQIQFLAAIGYVDAGDAGKAQKLATSLSSQMSSESQAYGKIVAGLIALKRKGCQRSGSGTDRRSKQPASTPGSAISNWGVPTWKREHSPRLIRSSINVSSGAAKQSSYLWITRRRSAYFPPVYYYQGTRPGGDEKRGIRGSFTRRLPHSSAGSRRKIRWFPRFAIASANKRHHQFAVTVWGTCSSCRVVGVPLPGLAITEHVLEVLVIV